MRIPKQLIVLLVVVSLSVSMVTPAFAASFSPLTGLISQISGNSNNSFGSELTNILVGLLLGKLFGNVASVLPAELSKTLAATSTPADASTQGEAIVATARKYMGTPYVWGGETPDGWDCSGFTRYVMNENGISIPRTADDQYAVGTPVNRSDLQVGDLVFFSTYKPGASHVGFYLGNNQFIHASSVKKQVTISSLDDSFYDSHYIGARHYNR